MALSPQLALPSPDTFPLYQSAMSPFLSPNPSSIPVIAILPTRTSISSRIPSWTLTIFSLTSSIRLPVTTKWVPPCSSRANIFTSKQLPLQHAYWAPMNLRTLTNDPGSTASSVAAASKI
ncbi:hypothetical protein WJX79_002783 [Trebouxia sp. C0005]